MAASDYNKYKPLDVTSATGSPSLTGFPGYLKILTDVKDVDTFEDGDYTSSPTWTEVQSGGTPTVQSTTVKNGSNALELATSTSGAETLEHDRSTSDSVDDGDVYTVWVRAESSVTAEYALTNSSGQSYNGNDGIGFFMQPGNAFAFRTSTSGGSSLEDVQVGTPSANTWYRVDIEIYPSSSTAYFRVLNTAGEVIHAEELSTSGATSLQYVDVENFDSASGSAYFDDVSYSTSNASDSFIEGLTGEGPMYVPSTNLSASSDYAVYTDGGVLLDYYAETEDLTNGIIELWFRDSLTRDGSEQVRLYFGSGSTDESVSEATVWDGVTNITSRWGLEETAGNYLDSTSNNNDSTSITVTDRTTAGQFGANAPTFDGADDKVDFVEIDPANNYAVILWFNATNLPSAGNFAVLGSNRDAASGQTGYFFYVEDDGTIRFHSFNGTNGQFDSTTSISASSWHQVVQVFDGTNLKGYIDGAEDASSGVSASIGDSGEVFSIAEDSSGTDLFDGLIDEVHIYESTTGAPISDDWIEAHYDMSPATGQTLFSQQAAQSNVVTIAAPTTSVTANSIAPTVNAGAVSVSADTTSVTANSINPAVSPGTATIAGDTTALSLTTPNPAVTLAGLINAPVTQNSAVTPNPTVTPADVSISASVTQDSVVTPNPTVTPGDVSIDAPVTEDDVVTPSPMVAVAIAAGGKLFISTDADKPLVISTEAE